MRNNWVSRIVVMFPLLNFLPACGTQGTSIPTIAEVLQSSNTVAPSMSTQIPSTTTPIPPTSTSIPPAKAPSETSTLVSQEAGFINPSIYDIPAMYQVTIKDVMFNSISEPIQTLPMKIHYPPSWKMGHSLPAVILANDWPKGGAWESFDYPWSTLGMFSNYEGWSHIIAANGLIAVSYETAYPDDLEAVVRFLQDNATDLGIDATRLGLYGGSSNSMLVGSFSNQEDRGYIKFAVYFYGDAVLADSPYYQPNVNGCKQGGCFFGELPKVTKLRTDLPIFVVDVGNFPDEMNSFLKEAKTQGVPITYVFFDGGYDGFDYTIQITGKELSPNLKPEGIKIIQQAIDFMIKYASAP